jgi:hypothetical protein
MRKYFTIYDPSEFPCRSGKFYFIFYQCTRTAIYPLGNNKALSLVYISPNLYSSFLLLFFFHFIYSSSPANLLSFLIFFYSYSPSTNLLVCFFYIICASSLTILLPLCLLFYFNYFSSTFIRSSSPATYFCFIQSSSSAILLLIEKFAILLCRHPSFVLHPLFFSTTILFRPSSLKLLFFRFSPFSS